MPCSRGPGTSKLRNVQRKFHLCEWASELLGATLFALNEHHLIIATLHLVVSNVSSLKGSHGIPWKRTPLQTKTIC